ncbi:MAG: elongation factor G [Chloroherpetonaceae bacterium]|nr:elongation factor G [Chthonomonadaceae bacterium]MDW8207930.1 elongation factor G [Chloroherpetonaceae bacterium]
MKTYGITAIRNVGLFGHQGSGKTSLAEALLYTAGAIDRMGRVDDGTATCDFDPEEQKRRISINCAIAPVEWHGTKINLVDVPGYLDFQGEARSAMYVVEAAILVTPAQTDPEVGFDIAWDLAAARKLPRAIFVNKMDRENADYAQIVQTLRQRYGNGVAPLQLPIGSAESFRGVIDLIEMKAFLGAGKTVECVDIPAEYMAEAQKFRDLLVESAAEGDDELMMKYLDGEELTHDDVVRGLHEGIDAARVFPVLCGSALKDIGMTDLLDIIVHEFPNPVEVGTLHGVNPQTGNEEVREATDTSPLAALVFKTLADPFLGTLSYFRVMSGVLKSGATVLNATTGKEERIGQLYYARGKTQEATAEVHAGDIGVTAKLTDTHTGDTLCDPGRPIALDRMDFGEPVFEQAIVAKTKVDEDKMGPALQRVAMSDPAFRYYRDPETGQTVIAGAGETHLAIVVERMRKFGANVEVVDRKVPYRETITQKAEGQGRHKKQTGGRGQFGDCHIRMEPNRGGGIVFVDEIVGGAIPRQYIPAVEKGIRQAAETGILAGYPVVDFKVTCYDGSYHEVDSSEAAFIMAGIIAFNNVASKAGPVLLEPILNVEVQIPEGMLGDVMSDLTGKRGRILGTEALGNGKVLLKATVPQAEMLRYAIDLRSITRGRGTFRTSMSHYEEVPAHLAQNIIANHKKEREAGDHHH